MTHTDLSWPLAREKRLKYGLDWDHEEGTVTYLQNKTFTFVKEMSNGLTESDHITTINAVMVVSKLRVRVCVKWREEERVRSWVRICECVGDE